MLKTVVLCGGKGSRMDNLTETIPKPLALVGEKPVLWHIMKIYSSSGFNEFVLCLGYKGEKIREYFENNNHENWKIEFVETGLEASKSQRLAKVKGMVGKSFFLAYGDDLADIDVKKLLKFHQDSQKIATVSAVRLESPFGIMDISEIGLVESFQEKPILEHWINGGFMVFSDKIFDYLDFGELEQEVFKKLVKEKQLNAFRHFGKWKSMNTVKDNMELNELWKNKKAFWKAWK